MISITEVLKRAPIWIIKFVFLDMQKFAHQIATHLNCQEETFYGNMDYLWHSKDYHIRQIIQHLTYTTRCLLNYAYINNIGIMDMNEKDQDYLQAKATWQIVNISQLEGLNPDSSLLESYSDRSYMYCILLWNCAQQIILNKADVYDDTIGDFFEFMVELFDSETTDERTQPLFKLISQLGHFHISYNDF